jgi:hypothetical protein
MPTEQLIKEGLMRERWRIVMGVVMRCFMRCFMGCVMSRGMGETMA